MAQKVTGYIKLQIPAGKATPAPPVGPALGQHGVNIMAFTKEFNERTKNDIGMIIPVVITVYADRSAEEGLRSGNCFRRSEQDKGCKHHKRTDSADCGTQDARPQRWFFGSRYEHDRWYRTFHGNCGC